MLLMAVIPAFRRLRQEDGEFETHLGYIVGPGLKTNTQTKSALLLGLFG
jgi:hypothetical protein